MGLTLKALKKLHRDGKFQPSVPTPVSSHMTSTSLRNSRVFDAPVEPANTISSTHVQPVAFAPSPSLQPRVPPLSSEDPYAPTFNELRTHFANHALPERLVASAAVIDEPRTIHESNRSVAPQTPAFDQAAEIPAVVDEAAPAPRQEDSRSPVVENFIANQLDVAFPTSSDSVSLPSEMFGGVTHDETREPVDGSPATGDVEPLDDTWSRLLARSEPDPQPEFFVSAESPSFGSRVSEFQEAEHTMVLGSDSGSAWHSPLDALQLSRTMVLESEPEESEVVPRPMPMSAEITSTTVPLAGLYDVMDESTSDESADAYAPVIPPLDDELPDDLASQMNHLWQSPAAASSLRTARQDDRPTADEKSEVLRKPELYQMPETVSSFGGITPEWDAAPAPLITSNAVHESAFQEDVSPSTATATAQESTGEAAEVVPVPTATMYEIRLADHLREGNNQEAANQLLDQIRATYHSRLPASIFCCSPQPTPRTADVLAELAMLLSGGEEDVLLVDANLGDQTLTRAYEVVDTPGLCDVLNGRLAAWEIIRPTSRPHVWIVPAGDDTRGLSRNAEPIHHDVLVEVMKVWQYHFHRVLVDVGTIDATTAAPFARVLDASLMVVPQPDSKLASLRQAAQHFKALGSQPLGCVVTDGH